jgi:hypothetical protein
MLFIVQFTDKSDSLALRERLLPKHLEWLEAHRANVLVSGSLRHQPDAAQSAVAGSLKLPARQTSKHYCQATRSGSQACGKPARSSIGRKLFLIV